MREIHAGQEADAQGTIHRWQQPSHLRVRWMLCAPGCWHGMLGGGGSMNLRSHAEWVSEAVGGSRAHVLGDLPRVRPKVSQELGPQEEA